MNGLRYQTTVRYTKQSEDEHCIRTNEQFIVTDASSLTEVEERVMNEGFIDPIITKVEIAKYNSDILEMDDAYSNGDGEPKWYKFTITEISYNDDITVKPTKTKVYYLVQQTSIENARKDFIEYHKSLMTDYVINSIQETKIMGLIK